MAIFAVDIRIVGGSHSGARSSAVSWCDYVMRRGQYHEKDGFDYSNVLLPDNAPEEWRDPYALWSAVAETESQWNAQTGREFMYPLPRELNREQCIELAENWARENLVSKGMVAHVVIHVNERGERHAHITATLRTVSKKGEFENKRVTAYPVRRAGEEMVVDAADWKQAKAEGWEKVYQFRDGKLRTKAECQQEGLSWKEDRSSQKPIQHDIRATDWNSRDNLLAWRKSWEESINDALDKYAPGTEHVDSRSYKDRGIDRIPEVKQGAKVTALEQAEKRRCEKEGEVYQPITVAGAKNAEIDRLNDLLDMNIPRAAKDELLGCGEDLHTNTNMNTADDVRNSVRPVVGRVLDIIRNAVADGVRRMADAVIALPIVRTLRGYMSEMKRRGVEVAEVSGDLRYRRKEYVFSGIELGYEYTASGIKSALASGALKARGAASGYEAAVSVTKEKEQPRDEMAYYDPTDIDSAIQYAKEKVAARTNETKSITEMGREAKQVAEDAVRHPGSRRGYSDPGNR